jgi:hypothetical protein
MMDVGSLSPPLSTFGSGGFAPNLDSNGNMAYSPALGALLNATLGTPPPMTLTLGQPMGAAGSSVNQKVKSALAEQPTLSKSDEDSKLVVHLVNGNSFTNPDNLSGPAQHTPVIKFEPVIKGSTSVLKIPFSDIPPAAWGHAPDGSVAVVPLDKVNDQVQEYLVKRGASKHEILNQILHQGGILVEIRVGDMALAAEALAAGALTQSAPAYHIPNIHKQAFPSLAAKAPIESYYPAVGPLPHQINPFSSPHMSWQFGKPCPKPGLYKVSMAPLMPAVNPGSPKPKKLQKFSTLSQHVAAHVGSPASSTSSASSRNASQSEIPLDDKTKELIMLMEEYRLKELTGEPLA